MTAVAPVVIECKGTWVGWPGIYDMTPNEAIPESDSGDQAPTAGLKSNQVYFQNGLINWFAKLTLFKFCFQVVPVNTEKNKFDAYYNGCCNGTFWPLFHSMPDRAVFKADTWNVSKVTPI